MSLRAFWHSTVDMYVVQSMYCKMQHLVIAEAELKWVSGSSVKCVEILGWVTWVVGLAEADLDGAEPAPPLPLGRRTYAVTHGTHRVTTVLYYGDTIVS